MFLLLGRIQLATVPSYRGFCQAPYVTGQTPCFHVSHVAPVTLFPPNATLFCSVFDIYIFVLFSDQQRTTTTAANASCLDCRLASGRTPFIAHSFASFDTFACAPNNARYSHIRYRVSAFPCPTCTISRVPAELTIFHLHEPWQGLLDMAFDPNFSTNNLFYLSHSVALGATDSDGGVSFYLLFTVCCVVQMYSIKVVVWCTLRSTKARRACIFIERFIPRMPRF